MIRDILLVYVPFFREHMLHRLDHVDQVLVLDRAEHVKVVQRALEQLHLLVALFVPRAEQLVVLVVRERRVALFVLSAARGGHLLGKETAQSRSLIYEKPVWAAMQGPASS